MSQANIGGDNQITIVNVEHSSHRGGEEWQLSQDSEVRGNFSLRSLSNPAGLKAYKLFTA